MKILVCVKQVCDAETPFSLSNDGKEVILPPRVTYRMNRYDEYALEEALRLKDHGIAQTIDAVSVGPERVASTLRRSLEMGAHNAYHVVTDHDPLSPGYISKLIAGFASDRGYDLVVAGLMSEDGMNAAVGPMIAGLLGISHATSVIECTVRGNPCFMEIVREIDASTRERFQIRLPAVLSVQSGINKPRYPSLSNVLRAKEQRIITSTAVADAPDGSQDTFITLRAAHTDGHAVMLDGDLRKKSEGLYRWLHERSFL